MGVPRDICRALAPMILARDRSNLLKLGDIVYLPYMILMYPFSLVNLDIRTGMAFRMGIAYTIIGLGLRIFLYGTITWFQSKLKGGDVADFDRLLNLRARNLD